MSDKLLTPILAGPKNVHFFEGRLLTARDLRDEQRALRDHRERLGRAVGAGVVRGLFAKRATIQNAASGATTLTITPGLALNRKGQALALDVETRIELAPGNESDVGPCVFADCEGGGTRSSIGNGVWVLVISPVSGYDEFAPMSGLDDAGMASGCGRRYAVEGVRFRAEYIDYSKLSGMPGTRDGLDAAGSSLARDRSKTRNLIANAALGTEEVARFAHSPLDRDLFIEPPTLDGSTPERKVHYGLVDQMRTLGLLSDCDVPLATLHWTTQGLDFVDNWSVRRAPHEIEPASNWSALAGGRRIAEGEAAFEQFREHLASIFDDSKQDPNSVQARHWFRYLPPVGVLPLARSSSERGFVQATFFHELTTREVVHVPAERLANLVRTAQRFQPVDLESGEMWRLYTVASRIARAAGDRDPEPNSYVVFVSGHVPFEGDAQFDLHDFNYANFAPGVGPAFLGGT